MIIAIDLDNTLYRSNAREKACEKFNVPMPKEFDLSDYPQEAIDYCHELWADPDFMGSMDYFDGALELLTKWKEEGHTLYAVTSRKLGPVADASVAMVERDFGGLITKTYVCGYLGSKQAVYEEICAELVIDDHFNHVIECCNMDNPPYVAMISNDRTEYNHAMVPVAKKIIGTHVFSCISKVELPNPNPGDIAFNSTPDEVKFVINNRRRVLYNGE